jgi:hypothetical protein
VLLLFGVTSVGLAADAPASGGAPLQVAISNLPPVVALPAVTNKTELEKMTDEFGELMLKRGDLLRKAGASRKLIVDKRRTQPGSGSGAKTETASKYREATLAVEKALDEHPRIKAMQAEHDVLQSNKVEISRQQADIVDVWQNARKAVRQEEASARTAAEDRAQATWNGLLKAAGVRDMRKLSEPDQKAYREVHVQLTNELAGIKAKYGPLLGPEAERLAREKDGSEQRFSEATAKYEELTRQQADLKAQMTKVRTELRKSDPAVAALQGAAYQAADEHRRVAESDPEVVAARAFLDSVEPARNEIDARVRVLRRSILAVEPASRSMLDKQAAVGGLALEGEDFWKIDS